MRADEMGEGWKFLRAFKGAVSLSPCEAATIEAASQIVANCYLMRVALEVKTEHLQPRPLEETNDGIQSARNLDIQLLYRERLREISDDLRALVDLVAVIQDEEGRR